MPSVERDRKYLHPMLREQDAQLKADIVRRLPEGMTARVISMHRTPARQFELFKQGREFRNGKWVVVDRAQVVTDKDGFVNVSRHNMLPCTALDIGLFSVDSSGRERYLEDSPHYRKIGPAALALGFDWGGNWTTLVDQPHVEIQPLRCFQRSLVKDIGLQWQRYLRVAGTYRGALDGIFGQKSTAALVAATGFAARDTDAWDALFTHFGPPESLEVA